MADHIIESKGATLQVINSSFTKEPKTWKTGSRLNRPGDFIDFEKVNVNSGRLIVHNTIFKAPSLKPDPNIIITNSPDFHFRNVTLLCSGNVHYHHHQRPDANYSDGKTGKYIFACSSVCGQNEYKILNSGHQSTIVNTMRSSSISMTPVNPKSSLSFGCNMQLSILLC